VYFEDLEFISRGSLCSGDRKNAGGTPALPGGFGKFLGSGEFLARGEFFGLGFDTFEHAAEDEVVEGKYAVPVEDAEQAFGLEFGSLLQVATILIGWLDAEFEDGDAGEFHLGAQEKRFVALDADYAPEVERFAVAEAIGVKASATKTGATHDAIHPSAQCP